MENAARLALVEENVQNMHQFREILYELQQQFNKILRSPHDYQLRKFKSNILKEVANIESFSEYLKYIGFTVADDNFVYPQESTLSNLRIALSAIERKIYFCFGLVDDNLRKQKIHLVEAMAKNNPEIINILTTSNNFLLKIQDMFNGMLIYEDPELQELARQQIPIVTLKLMALDRVREQQMQLKTGKIQGHDLPFDIALLMELMSWFKYKFFSWVDKPACDLCGGTTVFIGTTVMTTDVETCGVELYRCTTCPGSTRFPRYNDVRTLLRTRRGRCGEWANCFTLLCRALGYDTRYVYDTTDHVWCEVFDFDSGAWLHVDPCEARLDAPLMYCHGWGKRLCYVVAFSRDDLQDVTWRYTMRHDEVRIRRLQCCENQLLGAILALRERRQRALSEPRRRFLARRNALELVQLMQEREPTECESRGRISGSAQWRRRRGEAPHTFHLTRPALYAIRYHAASDKYRITCDGEELESISTWQAGVYESKNIFRKVEHDWQMVYLARDEGEATGGVSWRAACGAGLRGAALRVRRAAAALHGARVHWTVAFDARPPRRVHLAESPTQYDEKFSTVTLTAELSGGVGDAAWQHAQLFRQPLDDAACPFEIQITVEKDQ